ncbi:MULTISPECIES: DnaA N-terminal domain-containing protein [Bacillus cereus group]|jgi:chromosomal replication initiation ATPase DnaA
MKEICKKRGVIMKINWTEVKEKIRPQISKPSYETWFTNTTVYLEDDILTIYCPNEFARDWLESHYKELVFNTLREMFNTTFEIQFELKSNTNKTSNNEKSTIEDITSELGEQFKVSNNSLKYNDVDESNKRIRALEEKIMNLEKVIGTLVEKLDAVELKTQLEK